MQTQGVQLLFGAIVVVILLAGLAVCMYFYFAGLERPDKFRSSLIVGAVAASTGFCTLGVVSVWGLSLNADPTDFLFLGACFALVIGGMLFAAIYINYSAPSFVQKLIQRLLRTNPKRKR